MAWTFRKTKKLGPFRFTLSKKGIGASFGVKGARVGITPTGDTYGTVGGGGLHNKQILNRAKDRQSGSRQDPEVLPPEPVVTGDEQSSESNQPTLPSSSYSAGLLIGVVVTILILALGLVFVGR